MTRYPRMAATQAAARGRMLRNHLNALEQGIRNGQGVTVALEGDEQQELVNLITKKLSPEGVLSPEEQARYDFLYAKRHNQ